MDNETLDCVDGAPSVAEYFEGFEPIHEFMLLAPVMLCMMTLTIYVINLRSIISRLPREIKGNIVALLTIYPVSFPHHTHKNILSIILNLSDCCVQFSYLNYHPESLFFL
jgi:hypothetical protein